MPIISHMGVDYDSPNVQIQDNASATDLDNTKVPTGQTIESYFNSKFSSSYKIVKISMVACSVTSQTLNSGATATSSGSYTKLDASNNLIGISITNSWVNTFGLPSFSGSGTSITVTQNIKNDHNGAVSAASNCCYVLVIEYVPLSIYSSQIQSHILSKTVTADSGSNGVVNLSLNKDSAVVLGCYTANADLCYPVCHNSYGWYAAVENWAGTRKTNTSCTVTVYYLQI